MYSFQRGLMSVLAYIGYLPQWRPLLHLMWTVDVTSVLFCHQYEPYNSLPFHCRCKKIFIFCNVGHRHIMNVYVNCSIFSHMWVRNAKPTFVHFQHLCFQKQETLRIELWFRDHQNLNPYFNALLWSRLSIAMCPISCCLNCDGQMSQDLTNICVRSWGSPTCKRNDNAQNVTTKTELALTRWHNNATKTQQVNCSVQPTIFGVYLSQHVQSTLQ